MPRRCRSTEVITAIEGGLIGQIALTYVEWAGTGSQRVVVPWTIIGTAAEARAFADRIEAHFDPSLRRTSISGALLYAAESIETNEFLGLRRVIDVSGDGPNNHGRPVTRARDAVIARSITINGLPLMTSDRAGARWHLDDLDAYYTSCVIGGPGAFALPVHSWDQFARAVRRKLVMEIAGLTLPASPRPTPVARIVPASDRGATATGYDCLIGEKIWERNRRLWDDP